MTFVTNPINASIVLKDKEGKIIQPKKDKTYEVPAGIYSYTATLEGYPTIDIKRVDIVEDKEIEVYMYKLVAFANATDDELRALLQAHYSGLVDLSTIWSVGDTRIVHLNAMPAGTGANESHVAQNMTMVIIGINHDTLKEKIGSRDKAAITVQCRELLGNNGTAEEGYFWGSNIKIDTQLNYSQNPRRTWLNETFVNSMPNTFNTLIKTVVKKNLANHNDSTAGPNTEDKAFLLSCSEVRGNQTTYNYSGNTTLEGNQYPYYVTGSNRMKYINNNGSKSSDRDDWWLRSPSSYLISAWMAMYSDSDGARWMTNSNLEGLAPAFCL